MCAFCLVSSQNWSVLFSMFDLSLLHRVLNSVDGARVMLCWSEQESDTSLHQDDGDDVTDDDDDDDAADADESVVFRESHGRSQPKSLALVAKQQTVARQPAVARYPVVPTVTTGARNLRPTGNRLPAAACRPVIILFTVHYGMFSPFHTSVLLRPASWAGPLHIPTVGPVSWCCTAPIDGTCMSVLHYHPLEWTHRLRLWAGPDRVTRETEAGSLPIRPTRPREDYWVTLYLTYFSCLVWSQCFSRHLILSC